MRRLLPPFAIVLWLIAAYVHTLHGQIRSVHRIAPGVFTRIGDRWTQVSSGEKAGKTVEQLLKDVNLSKHGDFAADQQQNQSARFAPCSARQRNRVRFVLTSERKAHYFSPLDVPRAVAVTRKQTVDFLVLYGLRSFDVPIIDS